MNLDEVGLAVEQVEQPEQLVAASTESHPGTHLLQLNHEAPQSQDSDSIYQRPRFVAWAADAHKGHEGLLARQSQSDRRTSRLALRNTTELTVTVVDPLTREAVDSWAELYSSQVRHSNHFDLVDYYLRAVSVETSSDIAIQWTKDGRLVGGCIVNLDPASDALRGRYSAVSPEWRASNLTRAMYLTSADVARDYGRGIVTLGADPNMYGPALPWGLVPFKKRLGFTPIPAGLLGGRRGDNVTERVLSIDGLTDPLVRLANSANPADSVDDYLHGQARMRLLVDAHEDQQAACEALHPDQLKIHCR